MNRPMPPEFPTDTINPQTKPPVESKSISRRSFIVGTVIGAGALKTAQLGIPKLLDAITQPYDPSKDLAEYLDRLHGPMTDAFVANINHKRAQARLKPAQKDDRMDQLAQEMADALSQLPPVFDREKALNSFPQLFQDTINKLAKEEMQKPSITLLGSQVTSNPGAFTHPEYKRTTINDTEIGYYLMDKNPASAYTRLIDSPEVDNYGLGIALDNPAFETNNRVTVLVIGHSTQ